jgi:hypothetical protein
MNKIWSGIIFCGTAAQRGQGCNIREVSRSHTMTHHNGRTPLEEGSARRRNLYLIPRIHYPCAIQDKNPSKQAAKDPLPRGSALWKDK